MVGELEGVYIRCKFSIIVLLVTLLAMTCVAQVCAAAVVL